ncbi:MAG: DUF4156 domain-containing protein [Proteobacteria bacterium]|nr:DUF4156 domain-containing protein [Pseudomonadota bacterium]
MNKNKRVVLTALWLGSLSLSGCTYVALTEAGSNVAQSSAAAVANCTLVGDVSSQTKDKVVLERNAANVKQELIVLARNRAAELGASDLVEIGNVADGTASFKAYRCN